MERKDDIVHFGVLGMHWGKRNSTPTTAQIYNKKIKDAKNKERANKEKKVLKETAKSEKEIIEGAYKETISRLQKKGKLTTDRQKVEHLKKVKELKENKEYWDAQLKEVDKKNYQKEDLQTAAALAGYVITIVGSIAMGIYASK